MPPRALFLTPEEPKIGSGGGGLRSASLLAYLQNKYDVQTVTFSLRTHSRSPAGARLAQRDPFGRRTSSVVRSFFRIRGSGCGRPARSLCRGRGGTLLVRGIRTVVKKLLWPAGARSAQYRERTGADTCPSGALAGLLGVATICGILPAAGARMAAAVRRDLDGVGRRPPPHVRHADVRVFPNALPEIARGPKRAPKRMRSSSAGTSNTIPMSKRFAGFARKIWPRVRERRARESNGVCWDRIPKRSRRSPEAIREFA